MPRTGNSCRAVPRSRSSLRKICSSRRIAPFRRKIEEAILAVYLETRYSKDQILGFYLNRVYFGAGVYGIEAASERYFDKPATQLTLKEAAILAGIVKAPSRYNPEASTDAALVARLPCA